MMLLVISSPANIARLEQVQADLAPADGSAPDQRQRGGGDHPPQPRRDLGQLRQRRQRERGRGGGARHGLPAGGQPRRRGREGARNVVAVLNVCHNPESRERFVTWYNASQVGPRGTADPQALEHRGPWGMDTNNNHYQIDLNRDSVWATQQETRNVIAAYRRFNPQTFIDHHGETENFFFPPVALPVNPNLPKFHLDWLETYGRAIAAASDRAGLELLHRRDLRRVLSRVLGRLPVPQGRDRVHVRDQRRRLHRPARRARRRDHRHPARRRGQTRGGRAGRAAGDRRAARAEAPRLLALPPDGRGGGPHGARARVRDRARPTIPAARRSSWRR